MVPSSSLAVVTLEQSSRVFANMDPLLLLLIPLGIMPLSCGVHGKQVNSFLENHSGAIQDYIMTGNENGWQNCDIITDIPYSYEGVPQMTMDLVKLTDLFMNSALASSHCLLVSYDIEDKSSLSALLDFGRAAVVQARLALVLRLAPGIRLEMASNTTKLPFLVAAELAGGRGVQFLCPVVGESEPRLEQDMCNPSHVAYKGKTLRVGLFGVLG